MEYFAETESGFKWGVTEIERSASLRSGTDKGTIVITCRTPKAEVELYVTKTGKLRIFNPDGTEWYNSKLS